MSCCNALHLAFASWVNFDILISSGTAHAGRRAIPAGFCPMVLEAVRRCYLEVSNDGRTSSDQNLVQIERFALVEVDALNVENSVPKKVVAVVEAQLC